MSNAVSNVVELTKVKKCITCGETKELSAFSFHKHSGTYIAKCKPCNAAYAKEHRGKLNPELETLRKARHWNKLKSDPVRLAQRNENRNDYTPIGYDSRRKFLIDGGRICTSCKVGKLWDEFRNDKHGYNSKTPRCVECIEKNRKPDLRGHGLKDRPNLSKRKYGVTWEHVVQVLADQHGRCGNIACGKEIYLDVPNGVLRANIDHDHNTGKFRALLCVGCNTLLGKLENRPHIVDGLMTYLHKHRST